VELYSSFKLGIRNLSLKDRTKKCLSVFEKGYAVVDEYLAALLQLILSDYKKYQSKKWWSSDIVEMLFPLHLDNTMEFSGGEQNTDWLTQKAASHKVSLKQINDTERLK
jgi:hypothetical protein